MGSRYDTIRGFDGSVNGEINLLCVLLEEQTWTQILIYVHYSITVKRDSMNKKIVLVNSHYSPICLSSFSEIGFLRLKI